MRNLLSYAWICLVTLAIAVSLGCGGSGAPRSVLQVVSINSNRPLQSDVVRVNADGTATVLEDQVSVTISSTPADGVLNLAPGGPFSLVTLERYRVQFQSNESIHEFEGSLAWTVTAGGEVSGDLVIVPAGLKVEPPLIGLVIGGEIPATAHITIYGRESTSNSEVKIETNLAVHFANWEDK